jgi:hypothetical protein
MAAARRPRRRAQESSGGGSTTQQDDADIVAEVGAERDEESGDLRADEKSVLAAGAVDAESVRENRRLQNIVNRKRAHEKDVPFNVGDIIAKYDTALRFWPANTLWINVKRLSGGNPVTHVIMTFPKSGPELYAELMRLHGENDEAKYELRVIDSNSKEYRTNGQITLPDTRPKQQQQGQPTMTVPQYFQQPPPGYGPPQQQQPQQQQPWQAPQWQPPPWQQPSGQPPQQGAPPQQQPAQGDQQQQPQQQPAQTPAQQSPPPPAQVFVPPPPPGPDPLAMMRQVWEMFTSFQSQQPQPQTQQAPPPQMPPPPPSAQADPATMMQWMQQMWEMVQKMQPPAQPGAAQQPQGQNPMAAMMGMMGAPPVTPPQGTIWVPGFGFVPLEKLTQVVGGGGGGPSYRGPGGGYRPPYGGAPGGPGGPGGPPYQPPAPPPPQKSAAEQFQEAVGVVQTAVEAVRQVNALIPQQQPAAAAPVAATGDDDEESPVRIVDTGHGKIVLDKTDGTLRKWETGWANMKEIMDFVAEQREAFQKGTQQQQEAPKQLPPGYVEVTPGYQAPPGMVAVPVNPDQVPQTQQPAQPPPQPPQQQAAPQGGLPPPPANVPPPIQATPPPNRTWEAPTLPDQGEG